nr:hypothetical protein [Lentzea sp. NBRC 105346]
MGEQVEERVQPVVRDEVEERACLLRRPDHDLAGDLPRLQPARHTGFGPDERLRPHLGRQLDPHGGVEGDQSVAVHRVVESLARRGDDPVHRGDTDRAPVPHQRAVVRVRAVAQLLNPVVELLDALEHEREVGALQLVEPDVAEVRHEVQPDVGLVAAVGVSREDLPPLWQPAQEVGADLDAVTQTALRPYAATHGVLVGDRRRVADGFGDEVADLGEGFGVTGPRDGKKTTNEVEFILCRSRGVESRAATWPPFTIRSCGELDAVAPRAVLAPAEFRAGLAERPARRRVATRAALEGGPERDALRVSRLGLHDHHARAAV